MFGSSAAATLRKALASAGRKEAVVTLDDTFSFGPINPPGDRLRAQWVKTELGCDDWDEIVSQTEPFMAASLSPHVKPIAWISRRSAHDYANFLEWLWRLGNAPCEIVDVTDLRLASRIDGTKYWVISPALIPPQQFIENGLLDSATPLLDGDRQHYHEEWQRLRDENAPLRVIENGALVSAPLNYFDELVVSSARPEWRKFYHVVGQALGSFHDSDAYSVGDLVLASRLQVLIAAGHLEARGDPTDLRNYEVRLPSAEK